MTKAKPTDHAVVVDIINGLPAAWRETPPSVEAFEAQVRPFVEAGYAPEADYVWAELSNAKRGYGMADLADVVDNTESTD